MHQELVSRADPDASGSILKHDSGIEGRVSGLESDYTSIVGTPEQPLLMGERQPQISVACRENERLVELEIVRVTLTADC